MTKTAKDVMNPLRDLNAFTRAYIECALWASNDDNDDPMDSKYSLTDLAPECLQEMIDDCSAFQEKNSADINDENLSYYGAYADGTKYRADTLAGHDFWLTRNGHGSGFWDGGWQDDIGQRLTDAAHEFGECNLYIGDDGKIYS